MTRTYTSPTKISWFSMKSRCDYRNNASYHNYGGRGITYDPRWKKFDAFLLDMGVRPQGTTLERKDVDGDYCKETCVWANHKTQCNNKRNTIKLTIGRVTKTVSEWSDDTGVPKKTIITRFRLGWPHAECLIPEVSQRRKSSRGLSSPRDSYKGEGNGAAKLEDNDVRAIRILLSTEEWTYREIGEAFGVSAGTVSFISNKKHWAHVK